MPVPMLLLMPAALGSGLDAPLTAPLGSGVTSSDAAATVFAPAMLTDLQAPEVIVGGGLVAGVASFARERLGPYPFADGLVLGAPVDPADLDPSRTGPADPVSATLLAATADLHLGGPVWRDRLFLGGSITVPYAAPIAWPADGAQRWALREAQIYVPHATLAIAGTPHPVVRLGAGASWVVGLASLSKVQDFAGLSLLGDALADPPVNQPNDLGPDAPSTVREQDVLSRPFVYRGGLAHAATFTASLALRVHPRAWVSAAYDHGTPLTFRGEASLDLDDPFFTADLASNGLAFPARVTGTGLLTLHLPQRVRAGLRVQASRAVRLDVLGEAVLWSANQTFDLTIRSPDLEQPDLGIGDTAEASIDRRWLDAGHALLRVEGTTGRGAWIVAAGYQSPASPDATVDASSPDGHRLVGGLGGRLATGRGVVLHLDGRVQWTLPRHVTTSTHDLANGRHDLWLAALALHVQAPLRRTAGRPATTPSPRPASGRAAGW